MEQVFTLTTQRKRRKPFIDSFFEGVLGVFSLSSFRRKPSVNSEMVAAAKIASDWIQLGNDLKCSIVKTMNVLNLDPSHLGPDDTFFSAHSVSHSCKGKLATSHRNILEQHLKGAKLSADAKIFIISPDGIIALGSEKKTEDPPNVQQQRRARKKR